MTGVQTCALPIYSVSSDYAGGNLVSITSNSSFYLSSQYNGFNYISSGLNLANNLVVSQNLTANGSAVFNSTVSINGQLTSQNLIPSVSGTYNVGAVGATYQDLFLSGNLAFAYANIRFSSNNNLILHNRAYQGNVSIYVNSNLGNVRALHIDSSALITVYGDPVNPQQVATKNYVDNNVANVTSSLSSTNANLTSAITQLRVDTGTYMSSNVQSLSSNLSLVQSQTLANLTAANLAISALQSNTATLASNIATNTVNEINLAANIIASNVALTTYVNSLNSAMVANLGNLNTSLNSLVNALAVSTNANLTTTAANLAPIRSPVLTGSPQAPTPVATDSSANIATTAFVKTALSSVITFIVSNAAPSGTPTTTIWFQV